MYNARVKAIHRYIIIAIINFYLKVKLLVLIISHSKLDGYMSCTMQG